MKKMLSLLIACLVFLSAAPCAMGGVNYTSYIGNWYNGPNYGGAYEYELSVTGYANGTLYFDFAAYRIMDYYDQQAHVDFNDGSAQFQIKGYNSSEYMSGELLFGQSTIVMMVHHCSLKYLETLENETLLFENNTTSNSDSSSYSSAGAYYRVSSNKLSTRTGPGTDYDGDGRTNDYSGMKGEQVKVLTAAYDHRNEIWWVQVEVNSKGKLRRAYTGVKRFENMDVNRIPQESGGYSASLASSTYPFYGPGTMFEQHGNSVKGGTRGQVILEENGYVLFEYKKNDYKHRCWVPESLIY